jgi:hypothetical protein
VLRVVVMFAVFTCARTAWTQDVSAAQDPPETRAELLLRERRDKAEALTPAEPGGLEKALIALENDRILERFINPAEGFYPKMGNVTSGSRTALGPAYRHVALFGGHADLTAFALWSFDRYWAIDGKLLMPRLADERLLVEIGARLYSYPSEEFFGIGPNSARIDHVTYSMDDLELTSRAAFSPIRWLTFGGGFDYLSPDIGPGDELTPIGDVFQPRAVPGLENQPTYLRTTALAEINYREPRLNPRKGGRYAVTAAHVNDTTLERFGFTRVEVDLQQYINLYKDRRVLALHGVSSFSRGVEDQQVPFYLQKTLGGPDDLRGFRRFRFRDDNMVLFQAEYRWEIFTAVDGAIFYDTGMVAPDVKSLSLDDLQDNYGFGFRFGSVNGVFLRVEAAFGSTDGPHFIFRFAHVF